MMRITAGATTMTGQTRQFRWLKLPVIRCFSRVGIGTGKLAEHHPQEITAADDQFGEFVTLSQNQSYRVDYRI